MEPEPKDPEPTASRAPPAPGRGVSSAARARLWAWLREIAPDLLIMSSLAALAVLVVLVDLEGVSTGGDAIEKWLFVRQWFYANDFAHAKWDHHMARLGVNAVAYLVQLIAGRGPTMYYVPSVLATIVQVVFVYACGKRLGSRWAGVVGAMLLIYFPETISTASQLLPELFSGTYAIVATYFYLRYSSTAGRPRLGWLIAMSLTVLGGYFAKETGVFFMPGFAVAIWMAGSHLRERARDLAVFSGIFAVGVLGETAFYFFLTDYANRFAVVLVDHLPGPEATIPDFWGLFTRFSRLDVPWRVLFFSFLGTSLGVFGFSRDWRPRAVLAIAASYFFFLTFLVRHLQPLVLWHNFHSRYFDATAPFVTLVSGLFVYLAFREIWLRHRDAWLARKLASLSPFGPLFVLLLAAYAGRWSYSVAKPGLEKNALRLTTQMADVANDAYRRNLPIVSTSPDRRAVWAVYAVFLDDHLLRREKWLPDYDDAKRTDGRRDYLVQNPLTYADGTKLLQMMDAGCAVEVKTKGGLAVIMHPMKKLPPECDAELARTPRPVAEPERPE
jgi:hypothetical protein